MSDYSSERYDPTVRDAGPLPEGQYWVRPDERVDNSWTHFFMARDAWVIIDSWSELVFSEGCLLREELVLKWSQELAA
jgi:hypothetical protein